MEKEEKSRMEEDGDRRPYVLDYTVDLDVNGYYVWIYYVNLNVNRHFVCIHWVNFRLISCDEFRCKWTLRLDSLGEFVC